MNKIILATLATLFTSVAIAQTQLYGTISQFVDKTEGAKSVTTQNNLSRLGIMTSEKIAAVTARAQIETNLAANDPITGAPTKLGDRQSTVGLSHAMGTIDLGRNVHGQFLAVTIHDPFSTAYASVAGDHHNLRGLRMSDAVFVSFMPLRDVRVHVDRELATDNTSVAVFADSNLAKTKLSTAIARYDSGTSDSKTDVVASTLDMSKIAPVRVHAIYSRDTGASTVTAKTFGASMSVNRLVTVKSSYSETSKGAEAWNLGADYTLSKRTQLHAAVKHNVVTSVSSMGLGISHSF